MSAKATSPSKTPERDLKATESKTWDLPGYGEVEQRPLSFFGKTEFFAVLSSHIEEQLQAGADVEALLGAMASQEVRDALTSGGAGGDQTFRAAGQVLTQLVSSAPRLLEQLYLIWLGIEHSDRPRAAVALRKIDDDTGWGIIDAFIEQNGEAIADFFPRLQQLFSKVQATTTKG